MSKEKDPKEKKKRTVRTKATAGPKNARAEEDGAEGFFFGFVYIPRIVASLHLARVVMALSGILPYVANFDLANRV
ncbi:hypothetical protein SUGI_0253560 [Cryptomeria japonica]|nr:hypothetical protein SUGI_0253560 [Cryptomeria japonica]